MPPAIILLSGGLDSATALAIARAEGLACHCLSFDYGQRHRWELDAATRVARSLGAASHVVLPLDLSAMWRAAGGAGSALTDASIAVPKHRTDAAMTAGIPATYVPARNLVFLALAAAWAEPLGARDVFVGVNAVDYSGYPDCRPEFVQSFERTANLATKAGVEGRGLRVRAPLVDLSKAQIIARGAALGVDYALTHSCYDPVVAATGDALACGACDSCLIRRKGFEAAGVKDPTRYA